MTEGSEGQKRLTVRAIAIIRELLKKLKSVITRINNVVNVTTLPVINVQGRWFDIDVL
jgi:hypothetical protein